MSIDNSSFLDKIHRLSKATTVMGGLAVKKVGEKYLGIEINDEEYARFLRQTFGEMRGPVVKVLQFLATIPDALPKAYADEFLQLQANAPSMGSYFVKRRMKSELGPSWQNNFKNFEFSASSAASLGQVHKAELLSGKIVACKLQYPAMESIIETDLQQLTWGLKAYGNFNKAIDSTDVLAEIRERLFEETNYKIEQKNICDYQNIFKNHPQIHVPKIFPELSTKRLISLEWMNGKMLTKCLDYPQEWREQIADLLFYAWYYPLYHHGCIHGDPHPGNYLATKDAQLQLLDFGCVRYFSKEELSGIYQLYQGFLNNNFEQITHAYTLLGFKNLNKDIINVLNKWALLLYEPILDDKVRPIQKDFSGKYGQETAFIIQKELHKLGGVKPPRAFIFLDRAAVGLGAIFMRLKVKRNWHRLYQKCIDGNKIEKI